MKTQFLVLIFFSLICNAAEKKVTINPNAPKVWVPDEYTSFQTPPTPEVETENLFVSYNQNRRDALRNHAFNAVITATSAGSTVAALCIPDDSDGTTKTLRRTLMVTSVITFLTSAFRACRECRKKVKEVANYSAGPTPRHFYPATVSKGPSPFSQTRTLE